MSREPRIAIVGPGNLGTALAISLQGAGFAISALVGRKSCMRKARALAKQIRSHATSETARVDADVIWFCVPDSEIAQAAAQSWAISSRGKGRVALHSSGALSSDELAVLRRRGFAVASVHPLMTFVPGSRPVLAGVPFAIEGDPAATRLARRIVGDLGGRSYPIRKQDKAAYHAWGTFASPLFTALLAATEQVAAAAGVKRAEIRRRMIPILLQTLANYVQYGASGAFSGPIIRGDIHTVKKHLRALRGAPAARDVYIALARAALQYLPAKNKRLLGQILDSE
ncbi:MAG TPA: Rossmann-like and DUF2520 domain-containing protein [Candidatus Sulfotelmatobacter sp.]|nr:Rossmann-like and DUF2520 domain-containing protein [Candidatus Sulfotelmatobacter sp.]